jgi:hypothetical protein
VPQSVLEAIKSGVWDYEPNKISADQFVPTRAMPGSGEKLEILAERLRSGMPLWHPSDRLYHDEKAID